MSNAADVVMVGGDRAGRVVMIDLEKTPTFIDTLGLTAVVTYTIATRTIAGLVYRFAYPSDTVEPTDAIILAHVANRHGT